MPLYYLFLFYVCICFLVFLTSPFCRVSGVWNVGGLEVSTDKVPSIEAMNGSTVLLPCTYSSCIGIKNLYFNWHYNDNGTMIKVQHTQRTVHQKKFALLHAYTIHLG